MTTQSERTDLAAALDRQRQFLMATTADMTDAQARSTPTVSSLSVGGVVKHLCATWAEWLDFVEGTAASGIGTGDVDWSEPSEEMAAAFAAQFTLGPEESLADTITTFDDLAERADTLIALADLDEYHPLPDTPWFDAGATWTNRMVFLHLLSETAQHCGHADIIRETIDGQKTMG